ncbi:MAG: hypothetical protein PGN29_04620 [Gordonia paraffinivorans]
MTTVDRSSPPAHVAAAAPTSTVWIVELETATDPRHVHGVFVDEAGARGAVVDLLTTRFVHRWADSVVTIPNLVDFPSIDSWRQAVLSTWTLVDAHDIAIAWDEWQPR